MTNWQENLSTSDTLSAKKLVGLQKELYLCTMKEIKSNKELTEGQIIYADIYMGQPAVRCEFKEPVAGGYSKCIVIDADPDEEIHSGNNKAGKPQIKKNHARGCEYQINIKQIINE